MSWEPDRDYVPLPEVMEAHAENPNLRRLQYMRSQVSIDGKDHADVSENSSQTLRYEYNFNDPYDLMEFVEDKVPGTVTVALLVDVPSTSRCKDIPFYGRDQQPHKNRQRRICADYNDGGS